MSRTVLKVCVTGVLLLVGYAVVAQQQLTENYVPVVAAIVERGDVAVANYTPEQGVKLGNAFSRLYFDVFEGSGMEFTLGLKSQSSMLKLESGFSQVISLGMQGAPQDKLEEAWAKLKEDLDMAVVKYSSDQPIGFWGLVLQSFLILFREGVEAMLVVAALVAYLRRSGYADKVGVIWRGVVLALVASLLLAWVMNRMIQISGAERETIEGVTMLIAAVVLVYVSYWLFAKKEAERWQAFIEDQMDKAIGKGSLFALGFVAFLAVFREGAETLLFYQALIGSAQGQLNAIWAGMGIATVVLTVVYALIRLLSIRLPLGIFFGFTAVLLFAMAFVFTGKGLLELQLGGWLVTTPLEGWPMIPWAGIFPTRETMLGQAAVLAILPVGYLWVALQRRRAMAGAQAK